MSSNDSSGQDTQDIVVRRRKGAPFGNKNRFKNGLHSKQYRAMRHDLTVLKRNVRLALALAAAAAEISKAQ